MAGPLQVTSPALCSAPLTTRSTLTTCASASHGRPVTAPAALTPAHRPSGEALASPLPSRPWKGPSPWVGGGGVPRLLYVLSKEIGWPRAPHCCGWSRGRQLSPGEAVERPKHEAQAILSTLCARTVPGMSRLVAGGWEGTGGPVCLSRQGAWLGRCPGVGQGLGASAMPLFLHKGPLTCTSPERGTLQGPSLRMGTGNLQSKAPCRAGAVLQPSQAWRHLASRDGGGLGFACAVGTAQRSLCPRARQGHSRPLHTWVSMALLGDTCH